MTLPSMVARGVRLLPLLLALPAALAAQQRVRLAGDGVVYDLAGEVRLMPASGPDILVDVRPQGRDAGRLQVRTGKTGGWQTLRVVYPEGDIVYDRLRADGGHMDVRVREDGTFGDRSFWSDGAEGGSGRGRWWDWGGEGRRVTIRGSGSGTHAFADLTVGVPAGRKVALFLGVGRIVAENVHGQLWLNTQGGDVQVSRVTGNLRVGTGSGDVQVLESAGQLQAGTGSGDIAIRGYRGGGPVRLGTGSGDVRGESLTASDLNASTGSGTLDFRAVSAPHATFSTGSGDVHAALTGALQQLRVSTGSGNVRVALPAGTGAQLRFSSGSGDVETDLPMSISRRRRGELIGTIGDGRGSVVVSTGSGDLRLTRS